jgi:hypothetical protein
MYDRGEIIDIDNFQGSLRYMRFLAPVVKPPTGIASGDIFCIDSRKMHTFNRVENIIKIFFWEYNVDKEPDSGIEFEINPNSTRCTIERKFLHLDPQHSTEPTELFKGYISKKALKQLIAMFPYSKAARDTKI